MNKLIWLVLFSYDIVGQYFFNRLVFIFIYLTWWQCRHLHNCSFNVILKFFISSFFIDRCEKSLYSFQYTGRSIESSHNDRWKNRFFLKRTTSDGRVVSMTKNEYDFVVNFLINLLKFIIVSITLMVNDILLKHLSIWNLHYEKVHSVFLPLTNSSVTTGWRFLLLIISVIIASNTISTFFFPDWTLQ